MKVPSDTLTALAHAPPPAYRSERAVKRRGKEAICGLEVVIAWHVQVGVSV